MTAVVSVTTSHTHRDHSPCGIASRPVATNSGTTWRVRYPRFTSSTKWVAQVADKPSFRDGGWSVGFARQGDAFSFGVASFDEVRDLGCVTCAPATGC